MRVWVRMLGVAALIGLHQFIAPVTGIAQVDPCTPVPIPELCLGDVIEPSPESSPSPKPPKNKGGKKGGGGTEEEVPVVDPNLEDPTGKTPKGKKKDEEVVVPPAAGSVVLTGSMSSQSLIDILTPLSRYGVTLQDALYQSAGPFPVAGLASWSDDWGACRGAGCERSHEGLDIFAAEGTPLVATADGVVTQKYVGDLPGISLEIQDAQGIQYFYAHLSAWAEPIQVGDTVHVGQVIGYIGNTGNAITTPHHVHLEIQPGGIPVPPKPFVDRWLQIAELRAQQLVAQVTEQPLPETSDYRITRLFNLSGGGEILETGAERLLALAGIQPSVSSLQMAETLLGEMAWEIDWAGQADPQFEALVEGATADVAAEVDLSGVSPWTSFGASPAAEETTSGGVPEQGD